MPWTPSGPTERLLLHILERARDDAADKFTKTRKQIERTQAAHGSFGGNVFVPCINAAGDALSAFGQQVVSEALPALNTARIASAESIDWVRQTVNAGIDELLERFGREIDAMRTIANLKVNDPSITWYDYGAKAKRDAHIELMKAEVALPPAVTFAPPPRHIYNLLFLCNDDWDGNPVTYEWERVLEFSDQELKARYGKLDGPTTAELVGIPCVFAYEYQRRKDPVFGVIRRISPQAKGVKLEYEIIPVKSFVTFEDIRVMSRQLGIKIDFEIHRTHWDVKEVDLRKLLAAKSIAIPQVRKRTPIDITTHQFVVAFSFPGNSRDLVRALANRLEAELGDNTVFFDEFYPGPLTQFDMDLLLQDVYSKRSSLVVILIGSEYQTSDWCAAEYRAIRTRIMARENRNVMLVRVDDGEVDGVFTHARYIDARTFGEYQISEMIRERVDELSRKS